MKNTLIITILSLAILGCVSNPPKTGFDKFNNQAEQGDSIAQAEMPVFDINDALELVGKWRSTKIEQLGSSSTVPKAWEIEFKFDGTYQELIGYELAREGNGIYRISESKLLLKPMWRPTPYAMSISIEKNHLFLTDIGKWKATLERNAEPLSELSSLPRLPKTLEEAVSTLRQIIDAENLEKIRNMKENELGNMHFGLGRYIRNVFGLWDVNEPLRLSCGDAHMHPDHASGIVIHALWKSLQDKDIQ